MTKHLLKIEVYGLKFNLEMQQKKKIILEISFQFHCLIFFLQNQTRTS